MTPIAGQSVLASCSGDYRGLGYDRDVVLGLLAPIVVAGLLALALGGSPRGWSQQAVRWSPLATFSLIAQAALFFPPLDHQPWVLAWGTWFWVVSMLGVLAMLVRNTSSGKADFDWHGPSLRWVLPPMSW